jgi:S-adenosylmethionine-dependent methyltransferase
MKDKHPEADRNFDDLAKRFQRNIYDSMKGRLRLAILRRDFAEAIPVAPLSVLDIGAGQGQWASEMLAAGHRVLLTDVSHTMLEASRQQIAESDLTEVAKQQARWLHCGVQELAGTLDETFDLIVCHAVMEWLEQPFLLLKWIEPLLVRGGWISLIFYNRDGLIFKNLLRANYAKVENRDFRGSRGSLTPLNPLAVDELNWCVAAA